MYYCYDAWVIGGGVEERFTLKVFSVLRPGDEIFYDGRAYRAERIVLALMFGQSPMLLLRPVEGLPNRG